MGMKRSRVGNNAIVQWLLVGLFSFAFVGCSLQKRTTLPGWHWEHEKTAVHQGPISSVETPFKDRHEFNILRWRESCLQSEAHLSRTRQVSAQTSLPKQDVEALTMLAASEIDEANQHSVLMLSSTEPHVPVEEGETSDKEPNNWLMAALFMLAIGMVMLPSPVAGVLIGLAPFIFSVGQLVRLSRMEEAKKKKNQGKKVGYILLMLASVLVTIGLTSFLAFSAVVDAAAGSGWSFSWNYSGPG
tara:strand:- start:2750 stop:3481 length:732 start_codon:yes stop_codon:yes gene_type:complete